VKNPPGFSAQLIMMSKTIALMRRLNKR